MFGVANTCIGECNMPEHLRSSDFSTPCRCSGVCGGARAPFLKRTDTEATEFYKCQKQIHMTMI